MNLKSRLKPFTALAVTALAITTLGAGCSDLKNAQDAACCTEFKVGVDMKDADFGVNANIKGTYAAFANSASDLSATASASVADITTACQNIALDLGADPADPSVVGASGNAALSAWCALATAQIKANFSATGSLGGKATIAFTPPKCTASVQATANCQASCSADASCDIKANPPTCTGGTLSVECKGDCTAKANVDLACTGSCTGTCSGSCKASGGVAVDCKGKCDGTCSAGGASKGTGIQADGSCDGQCDGSCAIDATAPKVACSGTCEGTCSATCKGTADASVKCDGSCQGDYTPLSCSGGKLEGGCKVDANCSGSCNASASAKAECTPPNVSVSVKANANLDAAGQLQFQTALASLEVNLPKLLVVLKARAVTFAGGLDVAGSVAVDITTKHTGDIGVKGALCGAMILETIGTAAGNFKASVDAATSVAGSVTLG